ncbi:MAG: hypothetical protein ACRCZ9_10165 [Fusobacteriaceae bacterium]
MKYHKLDAIKADCLNEAANLWEQLNGLQKTLENNNNENQNSSNLNITHEMSLWFQNLCDSHALEIIKRLGIMYKSAILTEKIKIADLKIKEMAFVLYNYEIVVLLKMLVEIISCEVTLTDDVTL